MELFTSGDIKHERKFSLSLSQSLTVNISVNGYNRVVARGYHTSPRSQFLNQNLLRDVAIATFNIKLPYFRFALT